DAQIERGIARVEAELARTATPGARFRVPQRRWTWAMVVGLVFLTMAGLWWHAARPALPARVQVAPAGAVGVSRDGRWIAYGTGDRMYARRLPDGPLQRLAAGRCSEPTW